MHSWRVKFLWMKREVIIEIYTRLIILCHFDHLYLISEDYVILTTLYLIIEEVTHQTGYNLPSDVIIWLISAKVSNLNIGNICKIEPRVVCYHCETFDIHSKQSGYTKEENEEPQCTAYQAWAKHKKRYNVARIHYQADEERQTDSDTFTNINCFCSFRKDLLRNWLFDELTKY